MQSNLNGRSCAAVLAKSLLQGSFDTRTGRLDAKLAGNVRENQSSRTCLRVPRADAQFPSGHQRLARSTGDRDPPGDPKLCPWPTPAARGVTLDGSASGPILQPVLRAAFKAEALTSPQISAEAVSAAVEFRPDAPLAQGPIGGDLQTEGSLARVSLPAAPELRDLVGEAMEWSLSGRLEPETQVLLAERIHLLQTRPPSRATADWTS